MSRVNSRAFEYAKEITVAKMATDSSTASKAVGENTANFFEALFNKLAELEDKAFHIN